MLLWWAVLVELRPSMLLLRQAMPARVGRVEPVRLTPSPLPVLGVVRQGVHWGMALRAVLGLQVIYSKRTLARLVAGGVVSEPPPLVAVQSYRWAVVLVGLARHLLLAG